MGAAIRCINSDPVPAPTANPDEVRFEIPKNFTVTADTSGRGLVLMIINHRLENQNGYAFSPDAAKQVAGGLIKSADAALALKPSAPTAN
jgi:carbohydrate-binding DOMON domain-containing protein